MNDLYDRVFHLRVGENSETIIGLLNYGSVDRLFVDSVFNKPIKHTHKVDLSQPLGGVHYEMIMPYKNMDVHVTFRAHSHGVDLTTPKSEVPISLEEISKKKASEIYDRLKR